MKLSQYCWTTLESITQKRPAEIKLLVDEIEYPRLQSDSSGFVLHLSSPKILSQDLLSLHGTSFDNDVEGRLALWRMFRASLYHLCVHSVVTDFGIYSKEVPPRGHEARLNSIFSISIVEDYCVRAYIRALWPGLVPDIAYANYLSLLRFRPFKEYDESGKQAEDEYRKGIRLKSNDAEQNFTLADRIAANVLSNYAAGWSVADVPGGVAADLESLQRKSLEFEGSISGFFSRLPLLSHQRAKEGEIEEEKLTDAIAAPKLELYRQIADIFKRHLTCLETVHSFPYADNFGPNTLFGPAMSRLNPEGRAELFRATTNELGIDIPPEAKLDQDRLDVIESEAVLGSWEYSLTSQNSLVEQYRGLDPRTHLEKIAFPAEDYAEFARTRSKLVGQVSTLLEQLRVINFSLEEAPRYESGDLDLEGAIQALSSCRPTTDVFRREELLRRDEAWAIVIDSSKSLEAKKKEVRELAVCLAEIAQNLIQSSFSWACYTFGEDFYIVKDFLEPYDRSVKGRIGGLPSGTKTLLPDALKLAAQRLLKGPEEVKVLLVASDGFPLGYEGIEKELVKTIEQIRNSGILLVGLGIGSSRIAKYFRSNCVVDGTYDLMKYFVQTYVQLPLMLL